MPRQSVSVSQGSLNSLPSNHLIKGVNQCSKDVKSPQDTSFGGICVSLFTRMPGESYLGDSILCCRGCLTSFGRYLISFV